ncbi:MAG: hypothetical protein IT215_04945 [Chitinophagaceae bacterium]|nr:hypothetical protein [Chitinophagaceae bacterium]
MLLSLELLMKLFNFFPFINNISYLCTYNNQKKQVMSISNKQEALDRLSAIEREQKELRKAIEKFDQKSVFDLRSFRDVVEMALDKGYIQEWIPQRSTEVDDEYAYRQLKLIVHVVNAGWRPNFENTNEFEYYPWFSVSSGFAFGTATYHYDYAYMSTGSRLCFKSRELAEFAGKTFTDIYKAYLM